MTPLVFLHGVGGGHHAWEEQVPYFGGLGYPSHAWDQPGYGESALVEPYDLEHVSASLALLIEKVAGEPVVLVGHSMGGLIAQETYVRYPRLVKALALCFTSPAFAGNFLYSTGANEVAGRHTLGHFDLPFRHCTIELDGKAVVKDGKLVA